MRRDFAVAAKVRSDGLQCGMPDDGRTAGLGRKLPNFERLRVLSCNPKSVQIREIVSKSSSRNHCNRPCPRITRGFCRFGLPQRQNTRKFAGQFNVMAVRRIRIRYHADLGVLSRYPSIGCSCLDVSVDLGSKLTWKYRLHASVTQQCPGICCWPIAPLLPLPRSWSPRAMAAGSRAR